MCGPGPCVYGCLSVRVPSQAAVGSTVVPDSLVVADGPLAETDVSGVVGSGSVSVGLGLSVGSVGLWVGVGVVGVFVGDLVGDLVGVPGVLGLPVGGLPDDDGLSLGPVDPVDGAPLPLGVARLPDGPGVEGLPLDEPLRGVEASVGSSAGNPPSMPSSSAKLLGRDAAAVLGVAAGRHAERHDRAEHSGQHDAGTRGDDIAPGAAQHGRLAAPGRTGACCRGDPGYQRGFVLGPTRRGLRPAHRYGHGRARRLLVPRGRRFLTRRAAAGHLSA